MNSVDKAIATQLANIEKKTSRSLAELGEIIRASGLSKHGEIRKMLIDTFGLGYGDANTLVHHSLKSDGASIVKEKGLEGDAILNEIYSGPKAALRPIHDKLMDAIRTFGEFEVAPKKAYVSLRRKRQFAMIGPATNTRVEVGINSKVLTANDRLIGMPPESMCQFKVKLSSVDEIDAELIGWIKQGFDHSA